MVTDVSIILILNCSFFHSISFHIFHVRMCCYIECCMNVIVYFFFDTKFVRGNAVACEGKVISHPSHFIIVSSVEINFVSSPFFSKGRR